MLYGENPQHLEESVQDDFGSPRQQQTAQHHHHQEDHYSHTNTYETEDTLDTLDQSDDDDGDGAFTHNTHGTASSSSSRSKMLAAKSSLPCGMTMPVLMTLVIMIPIIFLVTYTALPLDEAIRADNFLDDHRDVFDAVREAALVNFYENFNASYYLFHVQNNNPLQARSKNLTEFSRAIFDKHMRTLINVMRYSDVQGHDAILNTLDEVQQEMAVERKLIDNHAILGPPYRQRQIRLMDKLTRLLLAFSKDPRCRLLRHHLLIYTVVRLMSLHLTSSAASVEAIIVAGSDPYLYYSNAMNLQSRYDSIVSKLAFTIEASEGDAERILLQLRDAPVWQRWTELSEFLLIDQNATRWSHLSAANASRWFNDVNFYVSQIDSEVLESFTDGKLLEEVVVRESLLMAFAMLGCVFALACVIFYNQKEQKRMERALDATAVLADAVQRFVPRNQLKTMGVRSITQVQPGMSTEVAQTITFSDIRDFTRLSESMSRLELFDWLQNYVSRMTKVVSEEKSYIMAFLGDGLGICSPQPTYAVNAAIKMHVAVEGLNLDIVAKGGTLPIQIGVGIHHGVVVAGVFGDAQRLSVSMVAPDVNFASRLEALTKSFGVKILASEDVVDQISSELFSFRNVGQVQVKGSSKAVKVFDIFQADSLNIKLFKQQTKEDFETAISLLEIDRPQADKIFERLVMQARMEGLYDMSSEMHFRRTKAANGSSNGVMNDGTGSVANDNSVLCFEKDGSFAQDPQSLRQESNGASDFLGFQQQKQQQQQYSSKRQQEPSSPNGYRSNDLGSLNSNPDNNVLEHRSVSQNHLWNLRMLRSNDNNNVHHPSPPPVQGSNDNNRQQQQAPYNSTATINSSSQRTTVTAADSRFMVANASALGQQQQHQSTKEEEQQQMTSFRDNTHNTNNENPRDPGFTKDPSSLVGDDDHEQEIKGTTITTTNNTNTGSQRQSQPRRRKPSFGDLDIPHAPSSGPSFRQQNE